MVLQKSQLLKVSSPVSQDKAHFDTSSDELETYCSSETFHSVNTSPKQKKQAYLQRADKYHLLKKKLGSLSFNYVQIADQTRRLKTFLRVLQKISRQGERKPRILQGLEWSKVGFKNEMVTKCESNKFHKEYMDKQNFYKLEFWIVLQVWRFESVVYWKPIQQEKQSSLISDLKAIKGHSFSLPLMSCGLFVLTYMMFSGILWIAF